MFVHKVLGALGYVSLFLVVCSGMDSAFHWFVGTFQFAWVDGETEIGHKQLGEDDTQTI